MITEKPNRLVADPSHRIICLKVDKQKKPDLYEGTRKYWKVNMERASQSTHVLAIVDDVVQAVFLPQKWYRSDEIMHFGRCVFEGLEDIHSDYIGKDTSHIFGKYQGLVKYVNL